MIHILVVDDDTELLELMARFFDRHGIAIQVATSGREMDKKLSTGQFDLIILDIMLPGEDGITLCRRIRSHSNIPVIMLTAVSETPERVVGLEVGADDYVTKPFDPRELLARVRAILRRVPKRDGPADSSATCLYFKQWKLDIARRELRQLDNTLIPISGGEFELLLTLMNHPGQLLSRDQLLDYTKGAAHDVFDRSIDVLISRLRRKIEANARRPEIIKTVRNAGYLFTPVVRRS
ncbi:response regulator [Salinicola halimionae]|uniref:response regulator n=1 Tax=Salinicola halimionae TaxID=1949081 RepID=UPI000DA15B90|nr:response regulator [Salinicola halimionae]